MMQYYYKFLFWWVILFVIFYIIHFNYFLALIVKAFVLLTKYLCGCRYFCLYCYWLWTVASQFHIQRAIAKCLLLLLQCYCPRGSSEWTVLCSSSFVLCDHDYSWTAAHSSMKFCRNMYLNNSRNPTDFENHRSRSQDRIFGFFTIRDRAKATCVHDNSWTAALSLMIFAWICTLTTAGTLFNFKVIGQRSKWFFRKCAKVHQIVFVKRGKKSWLMTPFSACRLLDPFQRYSWSKSRLVRNLVHCW